MRVQTTSKLPILAHLITILGAIVGGLTVTLTHTPSQQTKLFVLVIGLALLAYAMRHHAIGLVGLLALAPFNLHVGFFGHQTSTIDLLLLAISALSIPRIRLNQVSRSIKVGTLLLVLGSITATFFAIDPAGAFWGALRWAAASCILLAACSFDNETMQRAKRIFPRVMAISGCIVAVFAILQKNGIYTFVGPPYSNGRIDSTFGYYTQFAAFMALIAVMAIVHATAALRDRSIPELTLQAGAGLFALVGLGISLSRGGLLAAIVGILSLLVLKARTLRQAASAFITTAAIVALGFTLVPNSDREILLDRVQNKSGGDVARSRVQQLGGRLLVENPMGIGYGNFEGKASELGSDLRLFHAHRTPVQIGLDAGWTGLFGFLLLTTVPVVAAIRRSRKRQLSALEAGGIATLIGFLAQGWFDYLFYETAWIVLFIGMIWAASTGILTDMREQSPRKTERPLKQRATRSSDNSCHERDAGSLLKDRTLCAVSPSRLPPPPLSDNSI